jgi:hypothetical protein
MRTFITEVSMEDGKYEGPKINALTWQEAEAIAGKITWRDQGVILVGELAI